MLRGLYAITPDEQDTTRLVRAVEAALDGGARLVQYRSKSASTDLSIEQGAALLACCRRRGVPLIVNDSVELASRIRADGVHLGRDDDGVAFARRILGCGTIIGVSCYDRLELAFLAQDAGANYVAFGSFFPSSVKPGAPRPPLELLANARRSLRIPAVAIGGITLANAGPLIEAGAHMIAVIGAIFSASDIARATRELQQLFDRIDLAHDNA
jgi:thiamine-phosphate pyrophosphorylase